MTIKRTHKLFEKDFLKKNNHLKILDLGMYPCKFLGRSKSFF